MIGIFPWLQILSPHQTHSPPPRQLFALRRCSHALPGPLYPPVSNPFTPLVHISYVHPQVKTVGQLLPTNVTRFHHLSCMFRLDVFPQCPF